MYPTEKKSNGWLWLILAIVVIILGVWFLKSSGTPMPATEVTPAATTTK